MAKYRVRPSFEREATNYGVVSDLKNNTSRYLRGRIDDIKERIDELPNDEYVGRDVDARLVPVSKRRFDFPKLLGDYPVEWLIEHGLLRVSKGALAKAAGKPVREIEEQYMVEEASDEKRLLIHIKEDNEGGDFIDFDKRLKRLLNDMGE